MIDVVAPEIHGGVDALLIEHAAQPAGALLEHVLPGALTNADDDLVLTVAAVCQNRSGITENLIAVLFNSPRITQRRAAVVFRSRHL